MLGDKKSIIALLLDRKKGPESKELGNPHEDSSIGIEAAAQDILDAIKSDSAKELVSALCSFIDLYEPEAKESDDESSEPEYK